MADDKAPGALTQDTENAALSDALAAEHAAIWGYGVVGAALKDAARPQAEVVDAKGAYALPFPVLSDVDAAALAVVLEDGVAKAWVRVLDQSAERSTRELAVGVLSATEVRAVGWRAAAGKTPVTTPFPGLPD